MGKIPSKPVVTNQPWINGVTKLNQVNLTRGINQNISNIKTAVDGVIDALGGPGADPENLEEITYAALKTLRDGGNLDPGKLYRITDYMTTTAKADTRSAGHQFDVIVKALAANKLSEEAYAALHAGDTYFANSKLEAWKLWYSIDNDTNRFDWADATNGKGVIYRMIDEFENDLPYDFKNIQFKRYKGNVVAEEIDGLTYRYPKFINMHDYYADVCEDEQLANRAQIAYDLSRQMTVNALSYDALAYLYSLGTKGYEKVGDLSGDVLDFLTDPSHGALSNDDYIIAICGEDDHDGYLCVLVVDHSTPFYFYTFSDGTRNPSTGVITYIADQSLRGTVYLNIFEDSGRSYSLRFNVFIGDAVHDNTIRGSFSFNTMRDSFYNNTIGNYFYYNTIRSGFRSNSVAGEFYDNVVGSFSYNNVGHDFGYNILATFDNNTVEDGFLYNTLKNGFSHNTLGFEFCNNNVGAGFYYNTVGNSFFYNTVGGEFYYNTVGNEFYNNTIGNNFKYNTIGNSFSSNTVGSLSDGAFTQYCIFEDGVRYISLVSPDAPGRDNYIQNVHLHLGVKGASSSNPLVISVPCNLPYETECYLDDLGKLIVFNFPARIAWEDLKTLRNTARLVPGKQYRIIDYLTAVEQPECRSAGHPFDVVVTALTANTLSEDAKAVAREEDDYFAKSVGATWKTGITISDIELLYKMTDSEDRYSPPQPAWKVRTFTQMGTMVNPVTGVEVPYLFEPDPDGGGEPSENDRRYLFVGEYEFNGVVYDQWGECHVDGTLARDKEGWAYYELTNVVVDCERNFIEKAKLSAWKLKYCLDNDYDRFGFAVQHDVIKVADSSATYLYLRYPSLDGNNGLAWVYLNNGVDAEIEDNTDYDVTTDDIIYASSSSVKAGDVLDMAGTPVTVTATRIGRGVIYEMEDEWGNKLPYDFKNVQFKRYRVVHGSRDHDSFDDQYVGCKDINGDMASPKDYTIEDDSDFRWCYTFNWYNGDGGSEDYSIVGNISLYNDEGYISGCYKNVFGVCMEYDLSPEIKTHLNRMYLGNNVIWDDYENDGGTSYGFYSNFVGNSFYYNTLGNNFIWNTVEDSFYSNTAGKGFIGNSVGGRFSVNVVGDDFNANIVGYDFCSNLVGESFFNNVVGNYFHGNIVGDNFAYNSVGNEFLYNTMDNNFQSNIVGNGFQTNVVRRDFNSNTVGNDFNHNIIGNYIYYSSMKDGIKYIVLNPPSGSLDNKLQYITIGPSIYGASSTNRIVITPIRNASHEQEYVNADKEVNQVTVS